MEKKEKKNDKDIILFKDIDPLSGKRISWGEIQKGILGRGKGNL